MQSDLCSFILNHLQIWKLSTPSFNCPLITRCFISLEPNPSRTFFWELFWHWVSILSQGTLLQSITCSTRDMRRTPTTGYSIVLLLTSGITMSTTIFHLFQAAIYQRYDFIVRVVLSCKVDDFILFFVILSCFCKGTRNRERLLRCNATSWLVGTSSIRFCYGPWNCKEQKK